MSMVQVLDRVILVDGKEHIIRQPKARRHEWDYARGAGHTLMCKKCKIEVLDREAHRGIGPCPVQ